jgi:tetratricopeptide (TPR) repeat protein
MPSLRFRQRLALAALLLAIALAYLNSFHNGFHFDDSHTVLDNPAIRSLSNIPRFFTDTTTFSVLPANRTYRPIVSTTLALDYALGHGYQPLWFHIGTFFLFLLLVLSLYGLYGLLLQSSPAAHSPAAIWIALTTAAWFGLHPVMAETINYVIQRGDLYCTLGCVSALLIHARWPRLRHFGLYLLPFAAAMLSKPPAAVFPLLLLLYVYFFEATATSSANRWRISILAALPSFIVTALLLLLQSHMTPHTFAPSTLSAFDYRITQPIVWARYATALFLPLHLNVDTDLQPLTGTSSHVLLALLVGALFVTGLLVAIFFTARRPRYHVIAYGLLWFVMTQLPTSAYPLSEVENDHRMFFSFPGLMLAVVYAGWLAWHRFASTEHRQRLLPWLAAYIMLALVAYGYGVHLRNTVWTTDETLWLDDVQKSPYNGRGLMNYALTQMSIGAYPRALDYFTRALQFTPNYPTLEINLGILNGAMADQGDTSRYAVAEHHFLRAIALAPNDDQPYAYYGRWLLQHHRLPESITQLQIAVALNPPRLLQHEQLIQAELELGNRTAAFNAAQQTLAIAPDDTLALSALQHPPAASNAPLQPTATDWINLSLAQYSHGDYPAAIASAQSALKLAPSMAEAYNNIGAGYAALHQWDKAIQADQQAVQLNPHLQIARNNLAWAISQKHLSAK